MIDAESQQLIDEVAAITGNAPPAWAEADAPTLQSTEADALYLIGVIGGKDVGKSSLINALLGAPVAGVSNTGEGTARALAYVYQADAGAVATLLESIIPGRFDLVEHGIAEARGRVLLDLPDIDSIYHGHVELTRKVLRHMLFPVWVQSVEKYADQQPLNLLRQVVAGNAPENFLFVLTKADQLAGRHGDAAVEELRGDYARRVARVCELPAFPPVMAVASPQPQRFDLPALANLVLGRRSDVDLALSRDLARRKQRQTFAGWLTRQNIDHRLAAARRLLEEAESLTAARLTEPLVDSLAQRLAGVGAVRARLIEPTVRRRLSYWPIVNVIDATFGPLVAAVRGGEGALAPQQLEGRDLVGRVRGLFAELSQRDPLILELYARNKLWEQGTAELAAGALARNVERAVDEHTRSVRDRVARPPLIVRVLAIILTIGAALWFPIIQPVLEIVLQQDITGFTRQSVLLIVQLLGATYLIQSIGFLAIYFVTLWMWLRWLAYRRVDRLLRQTADADHPATAVIAWSAQLLEPLRKYVERLAAVQARIARAAEIARAA